MSGCFWFWLGAFFAVLGLVGVFLMNQYSEYRNPWNPPEPIEIRVVKALEDKIALKPQQNPEIIEASKALHKGNLNLAETLTNISDILDIIERNCKSFHDGHYPDYQVVAEQVRKLLYNKTAKEDHSLALKVFPNLKLHPMRTQITEESIRKQVEDIRKKGMGPVADYPSSYLPYVMGFGPEQFRILKIFDLQAEPIPLKDWLNQIGVILDSKPFSLREIILSVAGQSGTTNEYLEASKKMYHRAKGRRPTHHHEPMIIAIGEYITDELRRQIGDLSRIQN